MNRRRIFIGLAILVAISALSFRGYMNGVGAVVLRMLRPVLVGTEYVSHGIVGLTTQIFHVPYNPQHMQALEEEAAALRARVAYLGEVERENSELRAALGRLEQNKRTAIVANVIARSIGGVHDEITIDIGSSRGVALGMPVLAGGDILLGFVREVSGSASNVQLLSDVEEKIEIYIPSVDLASVAEGEGGGTFVIQIPSSFDVPEGSGIFAEGKESYIIGFVDSVEKSDAGPFQIIRSSIPIHPYTMRRVYVVTESHS